MAAPLPDAPPENRMPHRCPPLRLVAALALACAGVNALAQPGGIDPRRPGAGQNQANQFNLPTYSPPLTPYPPPHPAHQQPHPQRMHPQPVQPPVGYSALPPGWFCPPLNAYYPAVPQCPVTWVHIAPHGGFR